MILRAVLIVSLLGSVADAKPHHKRKHRAHHRRAGAARVQPREPASPLEPELKLRSRSAVDAPAAPEEAPAAPAKSDAPLLRAEAPPPAVLDQAPPPAILDSNDAPPPRHAPSDLPRKRRWGLVGGGVAMFLAGYALDVGATYGVNHQPGATSLIPIVGPLLQLRDNWAMIPPAFSGNPQVDGPANQRIAATNHSIQEAAYAVLAVDAAIQLIGVTMTVVGAVGRRPASFASVSPAPNGIAVRF